MMRRGPGGRGGPPGGGMMGASIPDDAQILHNGDYFKLGWVTHAPEFVLQREASPLAVQGDFDALMR